MSFSVLSPLLLPPTYEVKSVKRNKKTSEIAEHTRIPTMVSSQDGNHYVICQAVFYLVRQSEKVLSEMWVD